MLRIAGDSRTPAAVALGAPAQVFSPRGKLAGPPAIFASAATLRGTGKLESNSVRLRANDPGLPGRRGCAQAQPARCIAERLAKLALRQRIWQTVLAAYLGPAPPRATRSRRSTEWRMWKASGARHELTLHASPGIPRGLTLVASGVQQAPLAERIGGWNRSHSTDSASRTRANRPAKASWSRR